MLEMRVKEIAEVLGTHNYVDAPVTAISTDSRNIVPGSVFFALKGENFDGHDFALAAIEKGAVAVVCERECRCGEKTLYVLDSGAALLELAAHYIRKFNIPIVGITGSVGKTTTKEMTHAVLSQKFKTLKNEGNLNNEIGLPMTIFRLNSSYEAAVLEMGMSNPGEISTLSKAARPNVAIINNIGVSHIETLGSRENILNAKLEITHGMESEAPLILNADDHLLADARTGTRPVYFYGIESRNSRFKAQKISFKNDKTTFEIVYPGGVIAAEIPTLGRHNIYNALAAFAVGCVLGIEPEKAASALKNYVPSGMRQRIKKHNGITFIEDCYNASPDSQRAALNVLLQVDSNRKIAVLGDMLELGEYSVEAHRNIGAFAACAGIDVLLTYGEMAKFIADAAKEDGMKDVESFLKKSELADYLIKNLKEGDAVIFKASRGMKLEEVISRIYEEL